MRLLLALLSMALGSVYLFIGAIILTDLKRGWATMGFSHFGLAVIVLAATCGPHHLEHGIHLAFEARPPGLFELIAVLVGLPAGACWCLFRVEALRGGPGDRFVNGTPRWVQRLPRLSVGYVVAILVAVGLVLRDGAHFTPAMVPNVLLVGMYSMIGYYLLRTQLANRVLLGGWSSSGLALTGVFLTCSIMHAAWVAYAMVGRYDIDGHGLVIDWMSVPAALYFLWVVRSLWLGSLRDWNRSATGLTNQAVT